MLAMGLLLAAGMPSGAQALERTASAFQSASDVRLQRVVEAMQANRLDRAMVEVDKLIAEHPNFRLAHLIRGDLLLAHARPLSTFGNAGPAATDRGDRLGDLRAEAMARLRAYRDQPPDGLIPRNLLSIPHSVRHVIVVDASRSRLYLFENRQAVPRLVADFYATLGKRGIDKAREGDQKTPLGVYTVTSRIPGSKLPDLYGWGALPLDYPNDWDRRAGRTGYGIWLHGVPSDTFARAPLASDGCVALANTDMARLGALVDVGTTPVIIADRIAWEKPATVGAAREAFARQFDQWRRDWESRNDARYLAHYAQSFRSGAMDRATWAAHKRQVNASKSRINVELDDISIFSSPGAEELMVVTFNQDYRSSNLAQKSRKRQYWLREAGSWKIAYEGSLQVAGTALPESYGKARSSARGLAQSTTRSAVQKPARNSPRDSVRRTTSR